MSGAPKGSLITNSGVSPVAPKGGKESLQKKPVLCPCAGGSRQIDSPVGRYDHPLRRPSQTFL